MPDEGLKVNGIYRLTDGRVVRVVEIQIGVARCDVFDPQSGRWVTAAASVPSWMVREPCPDPLAKGTTGS